MKTKTGLFNLVVKRIMIYNTNMFITNVFSSMSCMLASSADMLWHLSAATLCFTAVDEK